MTKKHFEFVAALINAAKNGADAENLAILAADKFSAENPLFDEKKFLAACGIISEN